MEEEEEAMPYAAQQEAYEFENRHQEIRINTTVAEGLVQHLADLGVEQAFGVSGGAIAMAYDALVESSIDVHHFRHEAGAAFAAAEAYFASGKPTVVFATTGPGTLNVLTGVTAAKWDGAKVVLVSGATSSPQRGRWATQESSSYTLPQDALYTRGPIFDFALRMEHPSEFPEVTRRLSVGISRQGGFIAHVSVPMSVFSGRVDLVQRGPRATVAPPAASREEVEHCARLLERDSFAVWAGFGATGSSNLLRTLVERTGAKIFCSPRGKGVISEDHPQFLGVSGLGGHESVTEYMVQRKPDWVLVLGTRLGEATSFWDNDMKPTKGFIHVDLDPEVPGVAYPDAHTLGIHSEIGLFLEELLGHFPERTSNVLPGPKPQNSEPFPAAIKGRGPVRPQRLMEEIQRLVIDESDALVLAECGNSFAWCNHYLRFPGPGRYRVSTLFGSMGHCAAGVVGAALAREGKAVAVVGDGSMLMNSEISSATKYRAQAVWVVLNDSGYGMCQNGQETLGLATEELDFPCVDFVQLARSMGADGVVVECEDDLESALGTAMAAPGPFVVDVRIDTREPSPLLKRFESLIKQGSSKNVAGWEV